ncbi:MAG: ribosome-associated translation inhibitor RaiA [Bdellovibrionota bacterium]|nr:MAG: ribosome-associated translation inhibitor RaiA [Bdellovibrionota bacterium]
MTKNNHQVNVHLTCRNIDATEALRNYVNEKIPHCLQKFVHHDTEAQVILKVEKTRQIAECSFRTDGADFHVSEESENMYASIDALIATLTQRLRKHKEKLTSHY